MVRIRIKELKKKKKNLKGIFFYLVEWKLVFGLKMFWRLGKGGGGFVSWIRYVLKNDVYYD